MLKNSGSEIAAAIILLCHLQRTYNGKFRLHSGTSIEITRDNIIARGNTDFYISSKILGGLLVWQGNPWSISELCKKIRDVQIEINQDIKLPVDTKCTAEKYKKCISAIEELDFNLSFIDHVEEPAIEALKIFFDINHMYLRIKSFTYQTILQEDIDELKTLAESELFEG